MSIQGSINQMIASVGAAGFALRQKRAAESLQQRKMEIKKIKSSKERAVLKTGNKAYGEFQITNPKIVAQLKEKGAL